MMLLYRSDLFGLRIMMTREQLIKFLIDEYDDDMHDEDRFDLELILDSHLKD